VCLCAQTFPSQQCPGPLHAVAPPRSGATDKPTAGSIVGVVIIEPTKRCAFILCVSSRAWVRGSRGGQLIERARDEAADPTVSALVQQQQQQWWWWLSFLILGNSGLEQWSGSLTHPLVGDPCAYVGLHVHLRTARAGSRVAENVHVASAIVRIADWARTQ